MGVFRARFIVVRLGGVVSRDWLVGGVVIGVVFGDFKENGISEEKFT